MADGKELKPKSFRIDDETAEKFKAISNTIGGNQQETLSKLIEAYEFQSGKAVLTEKKADIEQFEKYVTALTRMYMGSLEDNQNLTETIRTEFDALLKSKEAVIQDLQGQLTVAKQLKEEATSKAKLHTDENARLNDYINTLKKDYDIRLTDMEGMLADKDSLNKALTDSCNDLKTKLESMKEVAEQAEIFQNELENFRKKYEELAAGKSKLEKQLTQEQDSHQADLKNLEQKLQLEQERAILKIEKQYEEQIQKLKATKQTEVEKYQKKYMDLWEKTKDKSEATKVNSKK